MRRAAAEAEVVAQLASQLHAATGGTQVDAAAVASAEGLVAAAERVAATLGSVPEAAMEVAARLPFAELLGPAQPASAAGAATAQADGDAWSSFVGLFLESDLQWQKDGTPLLEPKGDPLPDNLWTQFVAVQATLIKRLSETLRFIGIPQAFGWAVCCYTLGVRAALFPFVKDQLETTAKMQILAPRVNELKKKYKGDENRLNQEVGLLYMDLQIDPLGAIIPLLLQLPVFWGLYRAIRRLAIVQYDGLMEGFLWIPSLFGPNYSPDPRLDWLLGWNLPLIRLTPKIGWTDFGLYAILPLAVFASYKLVLSEATSAKDSPKILEFFPFMLLFISCELPQAMGLYIATNIASSVALTNGIKNNLTSKIPGYEEFQNTGKWPPGVDPEKVLAKAFGVQRLSGIQDDPASVPEAVFAGRADFIPELLKKGRTIDEFDDRGIPASAYTLSLDNPDLLERLFELGADPAIQDKRGNSLLHYCAGYGRVRLFPALKKYGTLDTMLDHINNDGMTPLDVARTNLSGVGFGDTVREMITLLEAEGASAKLTKKEDEAIYEAQRQKKEEEAAQRKEIKNID